MLVPDRPDPATEKTAAISDDEIYRWSLTRVVEPGNDRPLVVCGLNPSMADAVKNDNTIKKEIGFARRWSLGWLVKVNLFGFRTKSPDVMFSARRGGVDIVGASNDVAIRAAAALAVRLDGRSMVAWGGNAKRCPERVRDVVAMLGDVPLWCLGVNDDGSPEHPLYIPYERALARWIARAA